MTLIQWPGLFDSRENLAESKEAQGQGQAPGEAASVAANAASLADSLDMEPDGTWGHWNEVDSPAIQIPAQPRIPLPLEQEVPNEMVEMVRSSSSGTRSGPRSLWPRDGGHPLELLVTRPAGSAKARSERPEAEASTQAGAGTNALLERCRKAEQEVEVLRREMQSMEQQLSEYKQQLHQAQEAAQAQSDQRKHAEQEVQMLRRERDSIEQQLSQYKEQLQEDAPRHSERFENAEQELRMLRQQHQSMEQQLSLSKQQLQHAKDENQQQLLELEHQLAEAATKLEDVEQLKAQLKEARFGQQAHQLDLSWKSQAEQHLASLSAAEQRCEASQQKTLLAQRHAAEVERQRKELARNVGVQARQRLTEELEQALSEKAALEKRLKKAQRSFAEEQRLRSSLMQEMEISAAELKTFKDEASELSRSRGALLQKQRRLAKSEAGQFESFQAQLNQAEQERRVLQVELAKSQRLRSEEQKRRQAALAERDRTQHELQQLVQSLRQGQIHPAKRRAASPLPSPKAQNVEILQAANGTSAEARERLLQMIELAKERTMQRRHLSDAAEEVREQARALEELLTKEFLINSERTELV
ncbi:unnamed protein product [Cladocopium goreaui]|uniref:Reticulocyte-binding protein 2-like a n=1 Tax=Cladocopium goreaui TaxID=2562237 RepID=A0A9P1D7X8_9DINO|nr:unnamed protein product [Cladocopium goreaui]